MAIYRNPTYIPCDAGFGPLYYSFFNCVEDAFQCPPPPPLDPSLDCSNVGPVLAACCAESPGAGWGSPSAYTTGCIPDYSGGPSDVPSCLWIDGFVGRDLSSGDYLVGPDFILNAVGTAFAGPGGANPSALWAACGQLGTFHPGTGDWDLDPTKPDCYCQTSPLHCAGIDPPYTWNPIGQGCFCESFCPVCNLMGWAFDLATGLCQNGPDDGNCPPGTHWDPVCRKCVSEVPPRKCWVWRDCQWNPPGLCPAPLVYDPASCSCFCAKRACPPGTYVDPVTCTCTGCPAGHCWCETEKRCVECPDPPCKSQRSCFWDPLLCEWNCLPMPPGSSGCAVGEHYDLKACRCVPDCPAGKCWCATTSTCMDCSPPPCAAELLCLWDVDLCAFACQDPPCVAPATWTGPPLCKCVGGEKGPWNLFTAYHNYHAASDEHGILYERSNATIPPMAATVQVTTDPAHTQARMIRDWRHRTLLLYTDASSGTRVVERVSDDDGNTWSHPRTIFLAAKHPMPAGPHPFSGCTVYAAYDAGHITATRRYPGDTADSAPFTFKDDTGAPLAVDDASFGLRESWDGPGRWVLHVLMGGTRHHLESTDDCESFTDVT